MAKRPIHLLSVERTEQLSPHMKRVDLVGESLHDFPDDRLGGYIKFLLPKQPGAPIGDPASINLADYFKRSYTVRGFDRERLCLTIDAVVSQGKGPATAWIEDAAAGDQVLVTGPGPVKMIDPSADWVLIAGDMPSVPAIAVNAERLPASAKGYAVIEILSEEDKPAIPFPAGVEVSWLINPLGADDSPLASTVRGLPWLDGTASIWAAAEFATMRELRQYFRERTVTSDMLYLSSYWKRGSTDEEHKLAKRQDVEAG